MGINSNYTKNNFKIFIVLIRTTYRINLISLKIRMRIFLNTQNTQRTIFNNFIMPIRTIHDFHKKNYLFISLHEHI